ncbi:MAG TPA: hypothetical protein VKO38_01950 [Wenzhouxiangella sp.]|nr:hypothetical protein [Wenzhouxiangella sp.]
MSRLLAFLCLTVLLTTGCATRQVQGSLAGSTAQRLVTYSIDELMEALPAEDFEPLRNQSLWLNSNFVEDGELKQYADQRLRLALKQRFGISFAKSKTQSDARLSVFYTSLATDQELAGFYLPLGVIPGFQEQTQINLITLEKFHGIAELFYFIESDGQVQRGSKLLRRTKTDALGLPIITIPLTRLPDGEDQR